jgi:hypothetical protein
LGGQRGENYFQKLVLALKAGVRWIVRSRQLCHPFSCVLKNEIDPYVSMPYAIHCSCLCGENMISILLYCTKNKPIPMFGLGGSEMLVILIVIIVVVLLPLYFAYKYGYNKGYMKAMKESNQHK